MKHPHSWLLPSELHQNTSGHLIQCIPPCTDVFQVSREKAHQFKREECNLASQLPSYQPRIWC
jgi:hypothetical protein